MARPLPDRFPIFVGRDGAEGKMLEEMDREVERLIGRRLTTRISPERTNHNTQSRSTRRPLNVRRNEQAIPPTKTPEMQRLSPIVPNAPMKQHKATKKIDLRPKKLEYTEPEDEHPESVDSGYPFEKKSQSAVIKAKSCSKQKEIARTTWLELHQHDGLWIECSLKTCNKWRFTEQYSEPSAVPENWCCRMNNDVNYSSCSIPEEKIPPKIKNTLVECKYGAGALVWARMNAFPWWPAMVEDCPIELLHYKLQGYSRIPFKYHVVFIGLKQVERAWIYSKDLKAYAKNRRDAVVKRTKYKSIDYKKQLDEACALASQVVNLCVFERLNKFGWYHQRIEKNPNIPIRLPENSAKRPTVEKSIEIKYHIGDIVWARPMGYPWWPAMIDNCPILNEYYKSNRPTSVHIKYHVIYFNEKAFETDWRTERELKIFRTNPRSTVVKRIKFRNTDYTEEIDDACNLAEVAENLSLEERLERFGVIARFPVLSQEEVNPKFHDEAKSPSVVPETQRHISEERSPMDARLSDFDFISNEEIRWRHYEKERACSWYTQYNSSRSQSPINFEETGSELSDTYQSCEEIPVATRISRAKSVLSRPGSLDDESSIIILDEKLEEFMDIDISPVTSDQWPFDSGAQFDFESEPLILSSSDKTSSENDKSFKNSLNVNETIIQSSTRSSMSLMDFFDNFKNRITRSFSNN